MKARKRRLSSLLADAGVRPLADPCGDPEVSGVTLDSRRVEPGDLFFALEGSRADGVAFAPQAVERGARAVLAGSPRPAWVGAGVAWVEVPLPRQAAGLISREYFARPDEALTLVGITGTNGKTTVAHLVEAIARAGGRHAGRIGTVGYAFDGIERPAGRTTPEAPDFYRLLAEMRDASVDLVSIEVSSHALAQHRVEGARFATAAFLNLGRDHLDFHETEEAYFEAKARLFAALDERRVAVLPADDPRGAELARRTRARVIRFGRSPGADVRLTREHSGLQGSSAVLETPVGTLPVRTFLLGAFNLDNVAAAAACALGVGLAPEAIPSGILAVQVVPGRMEPVERGQPFKVLVDFAHTEDALRNLLFWMRELTPGRIHLVFGCGGDRDRGKRAGMGRVAAESGARIYLTSDNPRGEDPEAILADVAAGVESVPGASERLTRIVDRGEAIHAAVAAAARGDAVVIAGKGHETTLTRGDVTVPFDDREVAARAIAAREDRRRA